MNSIRNDGSTTMSRDDRMKHNGITVNSILNINDDCNGCPIYQCTNKCPWCFTPCLYCDRISNEEMRVCG